MHRYLICSALLLSACTGARQVEVVAPPPVVPADLLVPCTGYTGPVPRNEGQISDALIAEARGRSCANDKLGAIAQIVN